MLKKRSLLIYTGIWAVALVLMILLLYQNVGDARIINYSGIVRGATQKLVKEELAGHPDDETIAMLDGIIENLKTGKGDYRLNRSGSRAFQEKLSQVEAKWKDIKAEIAVVRAGGDWQKLYAYSQEAFDMADEMVLLAENYADGKLRWSALFLGIYLAVTILVFFFFSTRNRRALEKSFLVDHLTGIPNRAGFEKRAAELFQTADCTAFTIIKFDIDDFKFVNGTYGFEAGDEILKRIGEALKIRFSEGEAFARNGSDDFFVLARSGENLVEELRDLLQHSINDGSNFDVADVITISAGAYAIDKNEPVKSMMDKANVAHKSAKGRGKSSVMWYNDELLFRLKIEKALTSRLHTAIEGEEFRLFLQPKFDLRTRQVVGAEALVRWEYPGHGLLYPDTFIPLFEKNGEIGELDFYMLDKTCRHIRDRLDRGEEALPVSVNFSRVTLYNREFFDRFTGTVRGYDLPPGLIEVEITESAFNGITDPILAILGRLRDEGFTISMDDFGSGYSSLNLLSVLPIQTIKLDREFLKEFSAGRSKGIIGCVVELAKVLDMRVVCEGIETEQHLEFLKSVSCDFGQGYYFSKPLPEERYLAEYGLRREA